MSIHPLTHHEILGLVEPFARRGRHVDLASTDRAERRLRFKPIEHAAAPTPLAGARETLALENPQPGVYRLTRTIALPGGLEAALQAEGGSPGELLARIESVPAERQFRFGDGFAIAHSYKVEPDPDAAAPPAGAADDPTDDRTPLRLTLIRGAARLAGLSVDINAVTVRRYPPDIELTPDADRAIDPPDDLLAALGWDWGRLRRVHAGWRSSLRVRGREPVRTRTIEAKLETTVAHLAQTLSETPQRFHERLRWARWLVTLRRGMPVLVSIALVAAAFSLTLIDVPDNSILHMLLFHSPPLLLAIPFCMHDAPRLEIPPRPRPLPVDAWRPSSEPFAAAPGAPATTSIAASTQRPADGEDAVAATPTRTAKSA